MSNMCAQPTYSTFALQTLSSSLQVLGLWLLPSSPLLELDFKGFTKQINNVNVIAASNFRARALVKAYCTIIVCIQMVATAENDCNARRSRPSGLLMGTL
jgi:hypothetical protein